MRQFIWTIKWSHLDSEHGPSVNLVAPADIRKAMEKGRRWISKDENSDLSPDDCEMVSVTRGMELG